MDCRSFMPDVHQFDIRFQNRVENRHDMVARQREYALAAKALERLGDDVSAT